MTTKPKKVHLREGITSPKDVRATISDQTTSNKTLYLDEITFKRLSDLAEANRRSKIDQIRILLDMVTK